MGHATGKGPDDFLASYGADRARWPGEARGIARRASPGLEAEAAAIDQLLNLASQPKVPDGAMERLLGNLPDAPSAAVLVFRPRPLVRSAFFPI